MCNDIKKLWEQQNKKEYDRFPHKYSRDYGKRQTPRRFANGLQELIDNNASNNELCDYIDAEFLYGAWAEEVKSMNPNFLKDIRGIIISMYKE